MALYDCRFYNGYKPCGKSESCDISCKSYQKITQRVLLIHLGALGSVLRSTSLLKAIKTKHVGAHLTWLTQRPGDQLLKENPFIDQILTLDFDTLLQLQGSEWDVVYCVDKSPLVGGLLRSINYEAAYGFTTDAYAKGVVPLNPEADELWRIGISNHQKFNVNKKTECQLVHESLALGPYLRDSYVLNLNREEQLEVDRRRATWSFKKAPIIGINTGCSGAISYKKFTVEFTRNLIATLQNSFSAQIVLLGGKSETERNQAIAYGLHVIQSDTQSGLRDGILSVAACDVVVSGDSLGMHLGIALQKWVVAWFGPTCAHEIDFFDRGVAVLSKADCGPCWKRTCSKSTMCYDLVDPKELVNAVGAGIGKSSEGISIADGLSR